MKIIILGFLIFSTQIFSANAWYNGKISKIETINADGSFIIYMDNTDINSNCTNDYVEWRVTDMGTERTKAGLSMALTALTTGMTFGVVVDIPGSAPNCKVAGMGGRIQN